MSLLKRTAKSIVQTSHMIHLLGPIEVAAIFINNYEQCNILDYTSSQTIHRLTSKQCNTLGIDCAFSSVSLLKNKQNVLINLITQVHFLSTSPTLQ